MNATSEQPEIIDPLNMLRQISRRAHEAVDAAYSAYDLAVSQQYCAFLEAHARALFAAEAFLHMCPVIADWRPRASLLREDLKELGIAEPAVLSLVIQPSTPEAWGVLYVLEGSRLGGRVLSARVPPGHPKAYLSAGHAKGEWAEFLAQLRSRLSVQSPDEQQRTISAVQTTFGLFEQAARISPV